MLRSLLSHNWPKYLPIVVKQHNETKLKKLGFLKPSDINSVYDSAIVNEEKKAKKVSTYTEPPYQKQEENQKTYEQKKQNLQVGDYVYLNLNQKAFDKSFDLQETKFST